HRRRATWWTFFARADGASTAVTGGATSTSSRSPSRGRVRLAPVLRRGSTLVCALVLCAAAILGFASGNLWHAYRSGSPGTYWVLAAGTIALVASVVFSWREKRPRTGWWMAACIALPQIASLASSLWSGHKMDVALAYTIGEIVPRIVAEGTAELT